MNELSPKARFDALAALLTFDDGGVTAVRQSLSRLMPKVGDLVQGFNLALKGTRAQELFAGLEGERLEVLQSLAASFVLRTVNCNFDDAYCAYVAEIAARQDVPPHFIALALSVAQDFVMRGLPAAMRDDLDALARALSAWSRLVSILKVMLSRA